MKSVKITPSGLRIRPISQNGNFSRQQTHRGVKEECQECHSALRPIFVIAAVWSFGCWVIIWIKMYQSFTEDSTNDPRGKIARNEILAIKLEQLLDGQGITAAKASKSPNDTKSILARIVDTDHAEQVQNVLMSEIKHPQLILEAFLEPSLQLDNNGRLLLQAHGTDELTHVSYPYSKIDDDSSNTTGACSQNGAQWILPTFHPPSMDYYFEGNVFRKQPMFDKRWELASGIDAGNEQSTNKDLKSNGYCPVDADPYLPWLHDMFPSKNGKHVEFVISNKRRCNTDPKVFQADLKNLEPQVALMQPIPVKRIDDNGIRSLRNEEEGLSTTKDQSPVSPDKGYKAPRYVLAESLNDADADAKLTRFICRFHTVALEEEEQGSKLKQVVIGETLSNYPYNPEHANFLKRGSKPMLTSLEQGHDEQIWNSVYSIRCPVPDMSDGRTNLTAIIASGKSVSQPNGVPSIYVDLIPIRTPVRRNKEGFGLPGVSTSSDKSPLFDPKLAWGEGHILPRVEESGRWRNLPICMPPTLKETQSEKVSAADQVQFAPETSDATEKKHFLVACVWASHSFSTRGQATLTDSSTSDRLREFLAYHALIAGFDHIYVYDNSDTSTDSNINATLAPVTDLFPRRLVTRISWPHRVCNNNRPGHSNPGERSSQYAAESSCRARYGPDTEWMVSIDVDEFLIPVSKRWKNISHWLTHVTASEKDTKILSFFQTRALPNIDLMIPYSGQATKTCSSEMAKGNTQNANEVLDASCAMKDPRKTFMETYNCEPTTHPKPQSYAWRAKKQIYRPDFVLNHYVHYSVVTRLVLDKPLEPSWRFQERAPYERRVNELTEGFMLHTKTMSPDMTSLWQSKCPRKGSSSASSCSVGISSSKVIGTDEDVSLDESTGLANISYESNCYRHRRVMELIPELQKALKLLGK